MKRWGSYRGEVYDNKDPEHRKRLRIKCIAVLPDGDGSEPILDWALPKSTFAGDQDVGDYIVPDEGSNVWIEFEQGDIDKPVWTGGWTSAPQDESHAPEAYLYKETGSTHDYWDEVNYGTEFREHPTNRVIRTTSGHMIELDDESGQLKVRIVDSAGQEILFRSESGAERIQMTDKGGNHLLLDGANKKIHLQDVGGSFMLFDGNTGDLSIGSVKNLSIVAGENLLIGSGKNFEFTVGADFAGQVTGETDLKLGTDAAMSSTNDFSVAAGAKLALESGANTEMTIGGNWTAAVSGNSDLNLGGTGTLTVSSALYLGGAGGAGAARLGDDISTALKIITGSSAKVFIVD